MYKFLKYASQFNFSYYSQEDEDWPDTQQCSRLGLHFDTSHSATELSAAQVTAKKSPKSLITVGL